MTAALRPSAALRTKLSLAEPALHRASAGLWAPGPDLADRYRRYLWAMHGVIRASVPLMELAALRSHALAGDPVADPFRRYLHRHIDEERDHDRWLLADAAHAGTDPGMFLATTPPPAVARLVGAQYYWIEHFHPVALVGYLIALEGNAPAAWLADRLTHRTGLPPAAFDTVRRHADLDGGHRDGLDRLLDRLPLTAGQLTAIAVSALHTVDATTELFVRIAAGPGDRADRAPAETVPGGTPR